jgi:PHP family Zn ribbon phosphoesterase
MASSLLFACNQCGFKVESWSDGNPYIIGANGRKIYYYHPGESEQLKRIWMELYGNDPTPEDIHKMCRERGGNAPDHICVRCGMINKIDKKRDKLLCISCKCKDLIETGTLAGKTCMKCGGIFSEGVLHSIS